MNHRFTGRREAGQALAGRLTAFAGRDDCVVLALARGGVPVGYEVAMALHLPMEVLVVRKLGAPDDPELAIGAIGPLGVQVLDRARLDDLGVSAAALREVVARERKELARRERVYRHGAPPPDLHGKVALLVDDGVATGATMKVAIAFAREAGARRVVVIAPVVARSEYFELRQLADAVCALQIPKEFGWVGQFYDEFRPVSDATVEELRGALWAHPVG